MRGDRPQPMRISDEPGWRRVRYSRRRVFALLASGPPAFATGFLVLDHTIQPEFVFPWSMVLLMGPILVFMRGLMAFVQGTYFRYDIHTFAVKGEDPSGLDAFRRWRRGGPSPWYPDKEIDYPEPGFERLEYSVAFAEIYAVRADGTRKRLWMRAKWADPQGWESFVRHLRRLGALDEAP